MRYSCGHVSTKKNVRGIKDAATSMPPQLRSSRYIRYRDNIGYPRYGERYDIGDNQYSSNNLSYCPINRFLESIMNLSPAHFDQKWFYLYHTSSVRSTSDRGGPVTPGGGTHVQKLGTLVGVAIRSREDHSDEKITHHEVGWSPLRTHPINVRGGRVSDWEESQMLAALSR